MTTQLPSITDSKGRSYQITSNGLRPVEEGITFSRTALACIAFSVGIALFRLFA